MIARSHVICALFLASAAVALTRPASADPVPPPTPTPAPISVSGVITGMTFTTNRPNASGALDTVSGTDLSSRTQLSNALLTLAATSGKFRFNVTAGAYAFPVVGQALNPTFQRFANTNLYGYAPNAYVQLLPNANWTISAGQLPTLLGQENAFTFQNINIQRGLAWNAEPVVSRGVRVGYTYSAFSAALEYNDGFYSGNRGAIEGMVGWAPSPSTSLQFIFIVPDANTPSNVTAAVANKREYDLMYTQQIGKLQVLPYLLWMQSPSSATAGFTANENAFGAVLLANYAFNANFSLGGRLETIQNGSTTSDASANADFIGYGPGSGASSITLTPAYKSAHTIVRAEWSYVVGTSIRPGLGFGPAGTLTNQSRLGLEAGFQF